MKFTESAITDAPRTFSFLIGSGALILSLLVLVGGWALDVRALREILTGFTPMRPNTALSIGALGAALILIQYTGTARLIAMLAALLALGIGATTLAEYVWDWNAGIDQLLFTGISANAHLARPAEAAALIITLLGAALLTAGNRRLRHIKSGMALGAFLLAWLTLNSYMLGPETLHAVPAFRSVALHTAIASLLLAVATLTIKPVSWPLGTALARGTSGIVCRWLLPPALLAPALLGWLFSRMSSSGALDDEFAWALYSACSSSGSVALIGLLAHRIALLDAERMAATALSRHDPLTTLPNRRAFDSFLSEHFALASRHGHALSILLVDVDLFKKYNDTFGHPAGDELLKTIGSVLRGIARDTDMVARIGGDEFAVVLPETDAAGARTLAERMRVEIENSQRRLNAVSVSIGIASSSDGIASTSMLLRECDAALYRAKRSGRNAVSWRPQNITAENKAAKSGSVL